MNATVDRMRRRSSSRPIETSTRRSERAAYLDQACGGDAELRRRVERPACTRIAKARQLPRRARGRPSTSTVDHADRPKRPARSIGPYKLLEQIGEGGMGVVYVAEQTAARPPQGRPEDHQARHGHEAGHRPLRGRAPGPGDDGPPQHRQGPRRRDHRIGPPLLRHGAGPRHPDHRVLRPRAALDPRAAGAVRPGLPGRAARPPEGDHPPRPQALEHPGHASSTACRCPRSSTSASPRRPAQRSPSGRSTPASTSSSARRST